MLREAVGCRLFCCRLLLRGAEAVVQGLVGGRRIEGIERVDVQVVLSFGVWLVVRGLWWEEGLIW